MTVTRQVLRAEASAIIHMYAQHGGLIHTRVENTEEG